MFDRGDNVAVIETSRVTSTVPPLLKRPDELVELSTHYYLDL